MAGSRDLALPLPRGFPPLQFSIPLPLPLSQRSSLHPSLLQAHILRREAVNCRLRNKVYLKILHSSLRLVVDINRHPRLSRPALPSVMLGREGRARLGWQLPVVGADSLVYLPVFGVIRHFFLGILHP